MSPSLRAVAASSLDAASASLSGSGKNAIQMRVASRSMGWICGANVSTARAQSAGVKRARCSTKVTSPHHNEVGMTTLLGVLALALFGGVGEHSALHTT